MVQKLPFIEHFSITWGSGINLFIEYTGNFSLSDSVGKTIIDGALVCGNVKPLLITLLLVEYVVFTNNFVWFDVGKALTLLVDFIIFRGSILKINNTNYMFRVYIICTHIFF